MVDMIRNTEKSLGCEKKLLTKSEKKFATSEKINCSFKSY